MAETYANNGQISMDGSTAPDPDAWVTKTKAVLDTIYSNQLGKKIIDLMLESVIIKPYLEADPNAFTGGKNGIQAYFNLGSWVVQFSSDTWDGAPGPAGSRADEVLFHEFLHALEHCYSKYGDAPDGSLQFDGADFVSVNGTNVYSSGLSRNLRIDHHSDELLPPRYLDVNEHVLVFRENYEKAYKNNPLLFKTLMSHPAAWNPFKACDLKWTAAKQYSVEVRDTRWMWRYDLFDDFSARWIDDRNYGQFGIGKWKRQGNAIVVDWKGGGFDNFPTALVGQFVSGETKETSGRVHETVVKWTDDVRSWPTGS